MLRGPVESAPPMLVKASIAATALIFAVGSLSSIDFRELYDEMYPVNGLRRVVRSGGFPR